MNWVKYKSIFLDILFPPICLNCQIYIGREAKGEEKLICAKCLELVKINNSLFCPICRLRLSENKKICHHSQKASDEKPFLLGAATDYDGEIIQNLIYTFKYKNFESLAPVLGEVIIKYLKHSFGNWKLEIRNYILVPIPLHPTRERKRGFNQSRLLARQISKELGLEAKDLLIRTKNTKPQAQMGKFKKKHFFLAVLINQFFDVFKDEPEIDIYAKNYEKRSKNIFGAFSIINANDASGKNIILIDDVYTSGATVSEAARILKKHGAKNIIALVIAKA